MSVCLRDPIMEDSAMEVIECQFPFTTLVFRARLVPQADNMPVCVVLQTSGERGAFRRWTTRITESIATRLGCGIDDLDFVTIEPVTVGVADKKKILNQCFTARRITASDGVRLFRFDPFFHSHMPESVARAVVELAGAAG